MNKKLILWFVLGWAFALIFPPSRLMGGLKKKG